MSKSKIKSADAAEATSEPRPSPVKIATLEELQRVCAQTKTVEFTIDGNQFAVELRRLTPAEDAQLNLLLAAVVPPLIRGKTPEEDRQDFTSPDFLKRKSAAEIETRSLGLYWCVPLFKAAAPDLQSREEITAFVQKQFNSEVLDLLWYAVRNSGVTRAELVNFTSASGSTQS